MAEYIECRECTSPSCKGCNTYTLSLMLHHGKFNCLMDGNRAIHFADVVPVVRCVNCIHYGAEASAFDAWTPFCLKHKVTTFPDDFCSRGERRDGE